MAGNLLIKNCKPLSTSDKTTDILIENGSIKFIDNISESETFNNYPILNADRRVAVPGFIDVHIQGAGGADVLDATQESLEVISRTLARFGVTGFLATTVFKPDINNKHLEVAANCSTKNLGGAKILGIHLEGPFINPEKRGGISPDCILLPSKKIFEQIMNATGISLKMMTIAPEIDGNLDIIKELVKSGIIASIGHTNASYEWTRKGIEAGINHVTHIFNAMPPLHHRKPGPLLAIFESDTVTAQIISDGVHLHPRIVNFLYKTLGKDRCICITDGIQAIGLPEGKYIYNGREYISQNGTAKYLDGTLIGTSLSVGEIAFRFKNYTECSLKDALETVTKNPAKLLGIYGKKGSIEIGKDGDIVLLNSDFSIWATIVEGKVVFTSE